MNYRHAYHAGNFADVVKHIILTRVMAYLQRKDAACLYLDTHAGIGRYRLDADEAKKTGEAENGIVRFSNASPSAPVDVAALLEPYSHVLSALNSAGDFNVLPGSPEIMNHLRRSQDRCLFNELHPDDHRTLAANHARARKTAITDLDGWACLRAKLPPTERRGLVLIDPPFEKMSETDDLLSGLNDALKRFATGTYLIWYPLKDAALASRLHDGVKALAPRSALNTELWVQPPSDGVFAGSGMVIINPPYVLESELKVLLPWLAKCMERDTDSGNWATDWLVAAP
ncbi:MAG: 23S rRNA (adenine(2030)-N(6))-methyltransferase RlmJ [Pseudomonadota bacterium]